MTDQPAAQPGATASGSRSGHGSLAPVTLVGLASAGLTAVAGHQPWAHGHGTGVSAVAGLDTAAEAGRVPGCTALALVLLACWGVLLVTRGRVRQVVAILGLLAGLGAAAAVVVGIANAPHEVRASYARFGITAVHVDRGAWSFLAVPLVVVAVAAAAAAVRLVPTWPEMGRRYDAPGDTSDAVRDRAGVRVGEEQDDVGVWRAINEGHDPTAQ